MRSGVLLSKSKLQTIDQIISFYKFIQVVIPYMLTMLSMFDNSDIDRYLEQ